MKSLFLVAVVGLVACASKPPPPPVQAETTSASIPREAFTPPGEFEMTIADKPDNAEAKKQNAPANSGQADTTASKRQSGALMTLPQSKPR